MIDAQQRYASTLLLGFTPQGLPDEPDDEPGDEPVERPAFWVDFDFNEVEPIKFDRGWGELEVQEAKYANVGGLPFDDMNYDGYRGRRG